MKNTAPQPDRCIACSACAAACPVVGASRYFPGPRLLGPVYERFRPEAEADEGLHYCSNCKNCDIACPCDVPVSTFIMRARAGGGRQKARDWLLAHGEFLGRCAALLPARLKNAGLKSSFARAALDSLGIASQAPLPAFAPISFRRLLRAYKQPRGLPRRVAIFPGCFVELYDPFCGLDLVFLLNQAGYEAVTPDNFCCCGLPMAANGFLKDAAAHAAANLKELALLLSDGTPVIAPCPSCSLMFREEYRLLFPDLTEGFAQTAVLDACEFILGCLERGELRPPDPHAGALPALLYHAPCHLRAQGLGLPGFELLRQMPGGPVQNAAAGCCGLSGSYGFKKEKYALSMLVGERLFQTARACGAALAVSECGICRTQITHGAGLQALHPLSAVRRFLFAPG